MVTDIRMPPGMHDEGIVAAGLIGLRPWRSASRALVLSQYLELDFAMRVLESGDGSVGYLLGYWMVDAAAFVDAARRVARGETLVDPEVVAQLLARSRRRDPLETLTEREREVLSLMAEGRSNGAIAAELVVSNGAVEKHVRNIFAKLDLPPDASDHRRVLAVLACLDEVLIRARLIRLVTADALRGHAGRVMPTLVDGGDIAIAAVRSGQASATTMRTPSGGGRSTSRGAMVAGDYPAVMDTISRMTVASVYPHYVAKVEKKGRTKAELDQVIEWLTGFDDAELTHHLEAGTTFPDFFERRSSTRMPRSSQVWCVASGSRTSRTP